MLLFVFVNLACKLIWRQNFFWSDRWGFLSSLLIQPRVTTSLFHCGYIHVFVVGCTASCWGAIYSTFPLLSFSNLKSISNSDVLMDPEVLDKWFWTYKYIISCLQNARHHARSWECDEGLGGGRGGRGLMISEYLPHAGRYEALRWSIYRLVMVTATFCSGCSFQSCFLPSSSS